MKNKKNLSLSVLAMIICAAFIIYSCKKEVVKVIPTITIATVTEITSNTATSGGNITLDGGAAVTDRGVCWSLNQNPTTADSKTSNGIGIGSFTSSITGLTPGTTYYIKAYAINSVGTAYSSQSTFTTLSVAPVLTTTDITAITTTSATSGGNITNDGGSPVTARGVCWSTSQNPATTNNKTMDGTGIGVFTSSINGLNPGTTYYVRAYATNEKGTTYGDQKQLTTIYSGPIFNPNLTYGSISDIDGNTYKTIQIGTQTWMAENLKTTKYNDNTSIPLVTDNTAWSNLTTPGYCWYNNDATTYKATYGAMYNWYAVNTGKLCPTGWHVPTDVEWTTLTTYLGGESVAGGKLKETDLSHWVSPNVSATNEVGFTALPGGIRDGGGSFYYIRAAGAWWSSTENNSSSIWTRYMSSVHSRVGRTYDVKTLGFSVRCVRD